MSKSAKSNLHCACNSLMQTKGYLQSALKSMDNGKNKSRVEESLKALDSIIKQCEITEDIMQIK